MANFKNPTDNDDSRLGFLGTAASFAPLGYAAYHVGQRIRNEEATISPKEDATMAAIRKAADSMRTPAVPNMQNHLDWMRSHSISNTMHSETGGEIARLAWIQATTVAGPRIQGPINSITDTIRGVPATQVATALETMMTKHRGTTSLMGPVMRRFRQNYQAMSEHFKATGTLPQIMAPIKGNVASVPIAMNQLPSWMQPHIAKWQESGVQLRGIHRYTRSEFAGHANYMLSLEGPHGHSMEFLIPGIHNNTFMEGVDLRTRYISKQVGLLNPATGALQRLEGGRPELMMEVFGRGVVPQLQRGNLTEAELSKTMGLLRSNTLHNVETVPNVPNAFAHTPLDSYVAKKAQEIRMFVPSGVPKGIASKAWERLEVLRTPTEIEQSAAMLKNKLFGGVGPGGISEGEASLFDMSSLYMTPHAMDYSRRLEQFNRPWGLTARAASISERLYGRNARLNTPEMRSFKQGAALPPHVRMAYLDPDKHMNLLQQLGVGEGEFMLNRQAASAMEQEWMSSVHVRDLDKTALEHIQAGTFDKLNRKHVLGFEATSGKAITVESLQGKVLGATASSSPGKGDYMTLNVLHTHQMGETEKFYGGLKGMAHIKSAGEFNRATRTARIKAGIDAIGWSDDLRKNAGLHNQQMISHMVDIMSAFQVPDPLARKFLANPVRFARRLDSLVSRHGYDHTKMVEYLMHFSIKHGDFTPDEFGETFGLASSVLKNTGGTNATTLATQVLQQYGKSGADIKPYLDAMNKGIAYGNAQLWWGGPQRVGGQGSLEPRSFEIFEHGHFGKLGAGLTSDMMARMNYADPQKLGAHNALMRSLNTIAGQKDVVTGLPVYDVSTGYNKKAFQSFIEKGGGHMRLGKGFQDIYVPGADVFRGMDPFATGGGSKVLGYAPDVYHTIANRAAMMHTDIAADRLGITDMQKILQGSAQELYRHAAPGGKGMGGYLRNNVIGSQYLSLVTEAAGQQAPNIQTVLLPMRHAEEMIREMQESRMYDPDALEGQLARLRAGEDVAGMIMRHPNISEQSFQLMHIRANNSIKEPVMVLPSTRANVKLGMPGGQETIKGMVFGPGMGLANDHDGDTGAIFMLAPELETQARGILANQNAEYTERWMQHQLRFNVLKAKKGPGAMTLMDVEAKMVADTQKLGIGQRWTPKLSTSISSARAATMAYTQGSRLADAMAMFTSIEQQSIAGKHVNPEQILDNSFTGSLMALNSAITEGDATGIAEQFRELFKHNPEAMALTNADIPVHNSAALSKQLGASVPSTIKHLDIDAAAESIASAVHRFKDSGGLRAYELTMGRGAPIAMHEVTTMAAKFAAGSAGHGSMASVSQAALTAANAISAAGQTAIKNYAPLALGLAGSLAIATVLSSPKETIGPSGGSVPTPSDLNGSKGAKRMENLNVDSPPMGSPSIPPMMHQNRTTITPGGTSSRVSIRAHGDMVNARNLGSGLASTGVRSINLNVRDDRAHMNRHVLANRYFGR